MRLVLPVVLLLLLARGPSAFASASEAGQARPPANGTGADGRRSDPDAPPEARFRLAPGLTAGGEVEIEYRFERDFDLDESEDEDVSILEPELSAALSFRPNRKLETFLDVELSREFEWEADETTARTELRITQAYVLVKDVADGLSLKIGRQRFADDREWLYDEELDAVRAFYEAADLSIELSVSRKDLVDRDLLHHEGEDRIDNYLLYARYPLGEELEVAAYGLVRNNRSGTEERPIFLGLRSSGEIVDDLEYWLELAHVRGRDGSRRIRGTGFDVGATYELDLPLEPSVTLGYAFGTGDADPDDHVDRSFRQTGLQENEDRFNGVASFQYYGELFDPELSNLSIFTAGVGIRPTRKSSADLVYHRYRQREASGSIRDSEIDAEPTGLSRDLGSEVDLILGYEGIRNVEVEVALGYFMPGEAFPQGADDAFLARVEIEIEF